jgi:anti-sigma factor RsiW
MKCAEVIDAIIFHREGPLPDEVEAHLQACPDCRAYREQTRAVQGLLRLKRYEQPSEETRRRMLYTVRERITLDAEQLSEKQGFGLLWPQFRLALAAAVILMLLGWGIVHYLGGTSSTPGSRMASDSIPVDVRPVMGPVAVPDDAGVATNFYEDRFQYGTLPSRLVGFEY